MKLLVTGGAGFIGSNFVHYWVRQHSDDLIVVLDKLTYAGREENLAAVKDKITFVKGDICDGALVNKLIADNGLDTIVHFAAQSHVDRSIHNIHDSPAGRPAEVSSAQKLFGESLPHDFVLNNVWGTKVLLDAAVKIKDKNGEIQIKRFHHISTDEVFGEIPLDQHYKFNESSPYGPRSPYAATKAASDHLVNACRASYGLNTTITNCSNNFGPYQYPEKFIPRTITNVLEGKKVPLYKPGNQVRDWLFVEDHCRAVELVLQKGRAGETYCVGGMTSEISNEEVAKKILKMMGAPKSQLEFVTDRPGHDVKYAVDWSKIKAELGWEPQHNFDQWLAQTIEWYKNNEAWWKSLKLESEKFYERAKQKNY